MSALRNASMHWETENIALGNGGKVHWETEKVSLRNAREALHNASFALRNVFSFLTALASFRNASKTSKLQLPALLTQCRVSE